MKKFVICLFAFLEVIIPGSLYAQVQQIDVTIAIYELPNASAFTVQKVFTTGTEADRKSLAQKLREKNFPGGVKTLVMLTSKAAVGQRIIMGTPTEKRYATEYTNGSGAGAPAPTAYQMRLVGWTAECVTTMAPDAVHYDLTAAVKFTQQDGSGHFRLTGGGQTGNLEQPYFAGQQCTISGTVAARDPKLAAIFTPFREGAPPTSLGLIIVTVSPSK